MIVFVFNARVFSRALLYDEEIGKEKRSTLLLRAHAGKKKP